MSLTNQKYYTTIVAEANQVTKESNKENKAATATKSSAPSNDLYEKVKVQAELVRTSKANKAAKEEVTKQVGVLLALKEEYKKATGQEWKLVEDVKPVAAQAAVTPASAATTSNDPLYDKVKAQAELVRTIKGNKAPKDEVTKEVGVLLALKEEYKKTAGQEWKLIEEVKPVAVVTVINNIIDF